MPENNKKEKVRSVFNYKYFQIALAVPLALGSTLMIFIWCNDNLSLEWPDKKSLDTFLSYMSVPLWVMGSSIPLATLAAANFRAIQFQENLKYQKDNLEFQKRNMKRQEYEHSLDLFHKELSLFKGGLSSLLKNENFDLIKPEDTTTIFLNVFKKPLSSDDKPLVYDLEKAKKLSLFMSKATKLIAKLDDCNVDRKTLAFYFLNKKAPKHFLIDIDAEKVSKEVHMNAIKLALLVSWYTQQSNRVSNTFGVKQISMNNRVGDILLLIQEVMKLYSMIYNTEFASENIDVEIYNNKYSYHYCASKITEWMKNCDNSFSYSLNLKSIIEDWSQTVERNENLYNKEIY
ncbi:hypothetical protein [Pseudoalteromonas shioyasakiensis]|uniref:hypothetical protein n=1 Tax=Pseudoalteromonas shioyasakiensis TaxID=1190813 RepID=UPI0020946A0B|nr:hypothetical protein [Pseudoalteromonas shioyasakiensis]